jgi:hypothetical protein
MMSYQFSDVANVGNKNYFPLSITDTENRFVPFSRFIFLKAYSEDIQATWDTPTRAFGRLNPDYRYVQTNRTISLSFTLPAKNVAEAKNNLKFCSQLARTVYGNYEITDVTQFGDGRYRFDGARLTTKINFGNLIRNEFCFFRDFSFSPNIDAGVFEYSDARVPGTESGVGAFQQNSFIDDKPTNGEVVETSYVYHNQKGEVYPKEINVDISVIVLHNYPLGFGGPRRPDQPLSWAENKNRDWPHGTGPTYPVPSYVAATATPVPRGNIPPSENPEDNVLQTESRRILIGSDGRPTLLEG